MSHIIVEGCDCSGKSTAVKAISETTGMSVEKFSKPKQLPFLEYIQFIAEAKEPKICDRFYLGEEVYGPLWRGKSGLEKWQLDFLEGELAEMKTFNIYCCTDEDEIAEKFRTRGEELTKLEEIAPILQGFKKAISKSRLQWYVFDYRKDPDYVNLIAAIRWWGKK
jgi:thymidylate kinase